MEINFDTLTTQVDDKRQSILRLRHKLLDFVTINGGNVVIDPDMQQEANELLNQLTHFKREIVRCEKFTLLAKKLFEEHDIQTEGRPAFDAGHANLSALIKIENDLIGAESKTTKDDFIAGKINEKECKSRLQVIAEPHLARIEELEDVIKELKELKEF